MDVLRNNEEKIMCPYNAAHYIRKYRMEVHLAKCRKSYKESEILVECDFNACHRVPQVELQYHHDNCPDKKEVELQCYSEEEPTSAPVVTRPPVPPPVDDSWDEAEVPSYNPQTYCETNHVLRHLDTESAAKRRDFRTAERHRINNLGPARNAAPSSSNSQSSRTRSENIQNLPPTPSFSASNIEQPPDNVIDMMNRLSLMPKHALIPKQK